MWKSSIGIDPWPAVHIPVPCDHGPTTAYWTTFTLVVKSFANSDGWTTCIHKSGSWNDPKQRWGCLAILLVFCLIFILTFYFIKLTNVVYQVWGALTPLDSWIWINFLEFFEVVKTGIWTRNCFIPLICSKMIFFFFFSYKIGTTLKEICKNEKQVWKLQDVHYYTYRCNSIQAP